MKPTKSIETWEWARDYIKTHCIARGKMPGKWPNTIYDWQIYLRRGLFNAKFNIAIADLFYDKITDKIGHWNFQLTGLETAATPLITSLSLMMKVKYNVNVNAFIIRKEQKKYGLYNWTEGIHNKLPAMLTDDLCNSSASMEIGRKQLINENIDVFNYAFSVINKVNEGVHDPRREVSDMYLPNDITMLSLFSLSDIGLSNPSH